MSVAGIPAGDRFAQRAGDNKLQVLLKAINEQIPTHAVIFDVSTDRGIRSGNQSLTEIMYGLFLQSLGYAKDLDLSELEIALEEKGQLEGFEAEYGRLFKKEWSIRERQSCVCPQRGEPGSAQPRSRDIPDGRFMGEGGQEQGGHLTGKAGGTRE